MAIFRIPSPLRKFTDKKGTVIVNSSDVKSALCELIEKHSELKKHLFDDQGEIRNFVNLFIDGTNVKDLEGNATILTENSEIRIIPAIAGGSNLPELSPAEMSRFARHLILPEIQMEGQQKLKAAKVLIIGAGGLGSPVSLYLAAAGVGTLGLVDADIVDESNLQRQILYGVSDVNKPKVEAAAKRLRDLNPHTTVNTYQDFLTSENALDIIAEYDLVVDGTDNFPTRYLVNDACVMLGKTNVYGSIFRFEGQSSVFHYENGPCYRCLYPEPPPPGLVPSCAEGGVLGVLPAIIGSIQATEAVKIITGAGDILTERFILFDALAMEFNELKIKKDPNCVVCGDNPTVTKLIDYQQFCGIPSKPEPAAYKIITPLELKARLDKGEQPIILDVREQFEVDICAIENSIHIPMNEVKDKLSILSKDYEVIVHCKLGGRSAKICDLLIENGFKNPVNLEGGILAWIDEVDDTLQLY